MNDKEFLTVLYLEQVALKKRLLDEYLTELKAICGGEIRPIDLPKKKAKEKPT